MKRSTNHGCISSPPYREIRGDTGRVFRVGEDPTELLGRSRSYMIWLPWVAMMAAGVFEYAYGSAAKTLQATYNWSDTQTFTLVEIWGFFQAGIALPAGRLRERNVFPARAPCSPVGSCASSRSSPSPTRGTWPS